MNGPALFGIPLSVILGTGLSVLWFVLLRQTPLARRTLDRPLTAILSFALAVYALMIFTYPPQWQGNDLGGHWRYITYVYEHLRLPPSIEGWESYQPPIYYLLTVPFMALDDWLGLGDPLDMVRFLSLFNMLVFLLYSIALFRLYVSNRYLLWLATALLAFCPMALVHAGKINNDELIFSTFMASLYYLVRWQREGNPRDFWYSALIAAITPGIKTTGVMMCATVALCGAWTCCRNRSLASIRIDRRWIIATILLAMLGLGINFGRLPYSEAVRDKRGWDEVSIIPPPPADYRESPRSVLRDHWYYYVLFDVRAFINAPHYDPIHRGNKDAIINRNHFWNTFFKSALVGRGTFMVTAPVARFISWLFVCMLGFLLISAFWKSWQARRQPFTPPAMLVLFAVSMTGQMYMRVRFLMSDYAEARYVHYIVAIFLVYYIAAITWHWEHKRPAWAAGGALLGSAMLGIFLFRILKHLV